MAKSFEDIDAWKKWQELYLEIHKLFSKSKDFDFRHQINRATLSITNNIAEWFERQTNKEIVYFFYVSKWSCWEVRSMLYLAKKLNYINDSEFSKLIDMCKEISKMLFWFIKYIKNK